MENKRKTENGKRKKKKKMENEIMEVKMQEKIKENGNRKMNVEMGKYGIWSIESRVEERKMVKYEKRSERNMRLTY
jgi:hypothetical protein